MFFFRCMCEWVVQLPKFEIKWGASLGEREQKGSRCLRERNSGAIPDI